MSGSTLAGMRTGKKEEPKKPQRGMKSKAGRSGELM